MLTVPQEVIDRLRQWRKAVCVGHVTPDADCLAAMVAVANGFGGNGACDIKLSLPDGTVSQRLSFVLDDFRPSLADARAFAEADGIVAVDTAKASRCNVDPAVSDEWRTAKPILNIDHHESNTRFGTVNWVAPQASSTSEMVYLLLRSAGHPVPPALCSLLYAGIITDTAGFTLGTTGTGTLQVGAELVAGGADVAAVGERLYRSMSDSEFALLQIIHANTRVVDGGRIAYSTASYDEITGAGCSAQDIDEQVNVPRSLGGIRIALLLTEGVKGKTRINLRGESGCAVLDLARSLGGGGHPYAAGAILDLPIEEAVPLVLGKSVEYLRQRNG